MHGLGPGCGSADNQDRAGIRLGWKHCLFAPVATAAFCDSQELCKERLDFICQDGVWWKETGGGWAGEQVMLGRQGVLGQGWVSGVRLCVGCMARGAILLSKELG